MKDITDNLNDTIASAVKVQIEAKVLEALSGGEFFEKYVHAVLYRKIEVPDPQDRYRKVQINFIDNAISKVIESAVQNAVSMAVEEEREKIQDAVRKAVKRRSDQFAEDVTDGLIEAARKQYSYKFDVQLSVPR
ncbi:MAG: hypothetical protein A4E20_10765 [Nitrospira sp. SG-bin2]|uniref:hypothetical protein n=1 Tax=Nitrospira cf. moscoviensis SBR1015 TaxID=96242 RepID=UPI000A0D2A63|nr:hypothetical protein [Nitrospira cf. moscoviensis SBR1015]OQW34493.1 MAG: hypothetical protein A4E20_10765 [Nitrospira sp. SG-bin2]